MMCKKKKRRHVDGTRDIHLLWLHMHTLSHTLSLPSLTPPPSLSSDNQLVQGSFKTQSLTTCPSSTQTHVSWSPPTLLLGSEVFMTLRSSLPVYRTTPTTVPGTRDQVQMNTKAGKGAGRRGRAGGRSINKSSIPAA